MNDRPQCHTGNHGQYSDQTSLRMYLSFRVFPSGVLGEKEQTQALSSGTVGRGWGGVQKYLPKTAETTGHWGWFLAEEKWGKMRGRERNLHLFKFPSVLKGPGAGRSGQAPSLVSGHHPLRLPRNRLKPFKQRNPAAPGKHSAPAGHQQLVATGRTEARKVLGKQREEASRAHPLPGCRSQACRAVPG